MATADSLSRLSSGAATRDHVCRCDLDAFTCGYRERLPQLRFERLELGVFSFHILADKVTHIFLDAGVPTATFCHGRNMLAKSALKLEIDMHAHDQSPVNIRSTSCFTVGTKPLE